MMPDFEKDLLTSYFRNTSCVFWKKRFIDCGKAETEMERGSTFEKKVRLDWKKNDAQKRNSVFKISCFETTVSVIFLGKTFFLLRKNKNRNFNVVTLLE